MYTLDREVCSAKLTCLRSGRKVVALRTDNADYISREFLVCGGDTSLEANGITTKTATRIAQEKLDELFLVFKSTLK